jgi:prepilin-type N-terminal cleavage/methylation domain-containing protein
MKKHFSKSGVGAKNEGSRGFTLIELLVVIAIIAIISGMIMTSIYGSRSKARDAKRISDIAQIQLALEQYFDKNGSYPAALTTSGALVPNFISVIPTAPSPSSYLYSVKSDNFDYVLKVVLENNNTDILKDSLGAVPSGTYNPSISSCSIAAKEYCIGPK